MLLSLKSATESNEIKGSKNDEQPQFLPISSRNHHEKSRQKRCACDV